MTRINLIRGEQFGPYKKQLLPGQLGVRVFAAVCGVIALGMIALAVASHEKEVRASTPYTPPRHALIPAPPTAEQIAKTKQEAEAREKQLAAECTLLADTEPIPYGAPRTLCGATVMHLPRGEAFVRYEPSEGHAPMHLTTRRMAKGEKPQRISLWRPGASPGSYERSLVIQEHPEVPVSK